MRGKRLYILALIFLGVMTRVSAQWDTQLSQYWEVKDYYNPSYAGYTNNLRGSFMYRYNYAKLENSPTQTVITLHSPIDWFGTEHGIGVILSTDNIGSLRNNLVNLQYSYRISLGKSSLNMGVRAGIHDLNFDASSLRLFTDSVNLRRERIIAATTTNKQAIDLGTGISYINDKFNMGVAALHLNKPRYYVMDNANETSDMVNANDSIASSIPITYNFYASYNIKASNSLVLQPMLFGQYNVLGSFLNLTVRIIADDRYSGGISWVTNEGFNVFAGISLKDFNLGYAFSTNKKSIGIDNGGSHELFFRYNFSDESSTTKYKRHKSIRLL